MMPLLATRIAPGVLALKFGAALDIGGLSR